MIKFINKWLNNIIKGFKWNNSIEQFNYYFYFIIEWKIFGYPIGFEFTIRIGSNVTWTTQVSIHAPSQDPTHDPIHWPNRDPTHDLNQDPMYILVYSLTHDLNHDLMHDLTHRLTNVSNHDPIHGLN